MRTIPRWPFVIATVAIAAVALRFTVFRPDSVHVEVVTVERGVVEETVTNTRAGTVRARLRARLSPQIGGRVTVLPFREGDSVERGELLLKLDDSLQQASLGLAREESRTADARAREACLAADLAEKELKRGAALAAEGITTVQVLDALESERDRAQASCQAARAVRDQAGSRERLARAELALTEVRAPFAGVLAERSTEIGEWITPAPPGVPIPAVLDVLDPTSIYVSAPIDEVDSERVAKGQQARVTVDSRPGESFPGSVVRIAPFVLDVLEQNRTVEIEVELADVDETARVLPGTSADVEVILKRRDEALRIPTAAIAEGGKVLVVEGERLVERTVELGLRNWRFAEVLSGIVRGEIVVTSRSSADVKAGARVTIEEKQ